MEVPAKNIEPYEEAPMEKRNPLENSPPLRVVFQQELFTPNRGGLVVA
jgi:hypothetical protein